MPSMSSTVGPEGCEAVAARPVSAETEHPAGLAELSPRKVIIIIIIDNFCIALFSGVPKLTALYIIQHFLSFTNIIHIIMTTNNV